MKFIKSITSKKRLEYTHYVIFNRKKYIRKETVTYTMESTSKNLEFEDYRVISWKNCNIDFDEGEYDRDIEYFSTNSGWSKDGKLNKSNPVPEIEKIFKQTIGKDLIYF